jgi:hypothetical protein
VDQTIPVFGIQTMDEFVARSLAARRFALEVLRIFAIVAYCVARQERQRAKAAPAKGECQQNNLICNRLRVISLNVHGWTASKPSYKLAETSHPLRVLRRPVPANARFAHRPCLSGWSF